jgi:uridine kinase
MSSEVVDWAAIRRAEVHRSVSTWQQPLPPAASPQRGAVLDRIVTQILALRPGRLRVGVDGLTAAGKTSFGHELAEQISGTGRPVLRASLDDFKRPWRERHRYDRESGKGYYRNAFDYPTARRLLLEPAGATGSGRCVLCAIDPLTQVDHSTVVTVAASDAVLIVDGVFAFRPELDDLWDYRIWLEIDPELSVRRGGERDGATAGSIHRDRYLVAERLYLAEVDPVSRVDVVVDNTDFAAPMITAEVTRGLPIVERPVVRLAVLDADDRLLLLHTREPRYPELGTWWELPGGGIEPDESYVDAAVRELAEETGIAVTPGHIGPARWRRRASFRYRASQRLQYETVATVRLTVSGPEIDESGRLDYEREDYFGYRWWPVTEVVSSAERFYPGRLPHVLRAFLDGEEIDEPYEFWS